MKYLGHATAPILLIHGGAGGGEVTEEARLNVVHMLDRIVRQVWNELQAGMVAGEAVCLAVELLESSPCFNAGVGSVLQSDGLARLSASFMDGTEELFSAVALVTHLRHPIHLARALQSRRSRVIGPFGAQLLARELGLPPESPVTGEEASAWASALVGEDTLGSGYGTVGAVALDVQGRLAAATSSGGVRNAYPERISDVSTPAGNFSSSTLAVSCSGIGEQIMDVGLAVRLETRVRDGLSLAEACDRCLDEAQARKHEYGWISVERSGDWGLSYTTKAMRVAVMTPEMAEPYIERS